MTDDTLVAPVDLTDLITEIYRETLLNPSLDADSDFFEAGGDSLAAFQVTARLRDTIGADVPVALVFSYPSPADLAGVVETDRVG
ncbi:phosphopantetheine-binding protein [Micromonospora sp. CA-263727]|uniref:phosphopantetheine-binding protein n=1 Tax=Micromonospora sp. CA-263727 TaxID=3239967 RepID=UPI003D913F63